jgi:hypothetical protein
MLDRRLTLNKTLRRSLILSAVLIIMLTTAWHFLYFGERAVTVALGSIPGVRVRSVWGSADLIPKWYYARIEIAGAPSAFVYRLTRRSFDEIGELCFFQVGEYAVRYAAYGRLRGPGFDPQPTGGNSFCFDASGDVRGGLALFPAKIRGVRDFVQNIRVIGESLARWPRCPDFQSLSGANARYRVCTNPDVSTDIWPPEDGWGQ